MSSAAVHVLKIEPVDRFLDRFPPEFVTRVGGAELESTPGWLPGDALHVYVPEQSR
ncbi:MAG: hypothetical protein JOY65_10690 [Acetobacteraceae bacterium]|nr:hypothetical protein [Acetobacteraceae bacterium]MBV9776461.1 hypothetical protein [Acetobacteraceae bacterium]